MRQNNSKADCQKRSKRIGEVQERAQVREISSDFVGIAVAQVVGSEQWVVSSGHPVIK